MPDPNHLTWRTSTYSNNGGECVEVGAVWRTSTYSNNGGACVEVADNLLAGRGVVLVRDSKDPDGPVITLRPDQFAAFLREAVGELTSANGAVEVTRNELAVSLAGRRVQTSWQVRSLATDVTLHFTASEWTAFQKGAEHGEFDSARGHELVAT